jgi:hypothetical protein
MRGKVFGKVSSPEGLGRLVKRLSTERPPGVRRKVVYQSTVGGGREKQYKAKGLPGKDQVYIGEAIGEMDRLKEHV